MTDENRVVLITGVAGEWGGRLATYLIANQPDWHIIGVDDNPPETEIEKLDFIQASLHNPALVDLLKEEKVDTVCHLQFKDSIRPSEALFDTNVMAAMKVLGACAEAGVRKIVLKSSLMVYGAQHSNSAFLREDHPLHAPKNYGYLRDMVEIEAFCNGFQRQAPDTILTVLRFAHIVGPRVETPMTSFLREEEAMVLFGFDPMFQVIHEEDVVRALAHAVINDVPGTFNMAAEGIMPLWRVMGLAGKLTAPIFHGLAYLSVSLMGPRYAPLPLDYLRYRCVGDLRRMREEMQFVPQYTAEEALREFSRKQPSGYMSEEMARQRDEDLLRDTIERRRRAREQAAPAEMPEVITVAESKPRRAKKASPKSRKTTARQTAVEDTFPASVDVPVVETPEEINAND